MLKWPLRIALFVLLMPIALALMLMPFLGPKAIGVVLIVIVHGLAWPFTVAHELGDKVSYSGTLDRSSLFGCDFIAVSLAPHVQPQPFARFPKDKDWQPRVSGSPGDQPVGQTAWIATPIAEDTVQTHIREMEECGISAEVITAAGTAMAQAGSWVAYSTRGMNEVLLYSQPLQLALVFSIEP
jgi:hypothetical protein